VKLCPPRWPREEQEPRQEHEPSPEAQRSDSRVGEVLGRSGRQESAMATVRPHYLACTHRREGALVSGERAARFVRGRPSTRRTAIVTPRSKVSRQ